MINYADERSFSHRPLVDGDTLGGDGLDGEPGQLPGEADQQGEAAVEAGARGRGGGGGADAAPPGHGCQLHEEEGEGGGLPPVDGDQDDQEAAGPDEGVADQNINVGQVILDREWS